MLRPNNLKRIPENTISVTNTQTHEYHAVVQQAISGMFKFTPFALYQIIAGSQLIMNVDDTAGHGLVNTINVLSKLSMYAMAGEAMNAQEIELLRGDVEIIQNLLELRMRHCEHERDQLKESFNPDTYISQKLLLLDLKEWLTAYSVEIKEPVKKEGTFVVALS